MHTRHSRLTLVLPGETPAQLASRLREQEQTLAAIVAAPVRYLPQAFLDAVAGLFPEVSVEVPSAYGLTASR